MNRAVTQGNHEFRIRGLLVDVLQSPLHIHRDRSGHDECVGMARRGGDVNAEPLDVVNRIGQGIHLHLTTVAGTGVHFANRQGLSERQSFLASLRRECVGRLRGLGILSRRNPSLQTLRISLPPDSTVPTSGTPSSMEPIFQEYLV
jgi:hypothetical protein